MPIGSATIRDTWDHYNTMIDPHTADGVKVGRKHARPICR